VRIRSPSTVEFLDETLQFLLRRTAQRRCQLYPVSKHTVGVGGRRSVVRPKTVQPTCVVEPDGVGENDCASRADVLCYYNVRHWERDDKHSLSWSFGRSVGRSVAQQAPRHLTALVVGQSTRALAAVVAAVTAARAAATAAAVDTRCPTPIAVPGAVPNGRC